MRRANYAIQDQMASSEIPHGHEPGKRWCLPCYVVIREALEDCPFCNGLLHRIGNEQICDMCGRKQVASGSER